MLSLVMHPGLPEEQSFPLAIGKATIGRTKDNDVTCFHKSLSRKHAELDCDGTRVRVTDLQSKNGVFFNGRRIARCELVEGDSFRCGDVTFLLEGATTRSPKASSIAQTLPSPFAIDPSASKRPTKIPSPVIVEDDERYKDKLFAVIRASELLVGDMKLDRVLDELVVLAVQVLEVERIALLTLDERTLSLRPDVIKTFVGGAARPYSKRVVDWVIDRGSAASFADVSQANELAGDAAADAGIRGAMCAPINPGGGTIGVLYVDSLSQADCFRPDDLAVLRALANLAAVAIESDALRSADRKSSPT